MLIVPVKEGENIERALKRYKKKFDRTGRMRSVRSRREYVKPSVERRAEIKKAIYVQQKHREG
jgi:small subunit ribosomal protein S21